MARKRNFNFNDFPLSSLSCNSLTRPTPASLELPSAFHVTATRPHLFLWLIFFGLTFFAFHFFPSLQAQETNVTAAPMAPPAPTASSPWSFNFGKQPRPQDARTVIDAQDGAWFDDASNTVEFFGKVVVHDPQFTLTCDRLNVVLNKNRQGLQLVTATGNVNIEQQGTNDSGEKVMSAGKAGVAIYEPATGDITLRIWPQVHQGKNFQVATEEGTVMVLNNRGTFRTKGQTRTMILDAQQKGKNN